jgi:hypothetical protein
MENIHGSLPNDDGINVNLFINKRHKQRGIVDFRLLCFKITYQMKNYLP